MVIIKTPHHLFKRFLLPAQGSTDEHGLAIRRMVPTHPWGQPCHAPATRAAARARGQGARCCPRGCPAEAALRPPQRRGATRRGDRSVPRPLSRLGPAACALTPTLAHAVLLTGTLFPYWFGEPPLLFILFLLCPGVSMFDSVLVSIRSGSRSLLRNDFWCCLSPDRVSVCVSRDLFQLVLPSWISAVEPIHPPSITAAVPPRSPVPRGARPNPAVQSFGTIAAVSASFTSTKRPKMKGLWPQPHCPSGLERIPNPPVLLA